MKHFISCIPNQINEEKMGWADGTPSQEKYTYIAGGKTHRKDHLEDLGSDGKILKWILCNQTNYIHSRWGSVAVTREMLSTECMLMQILMSWLVITLKMEQWQT
jgi:hypothetical protein